MQINRCEVFDFTRKIIENEEFVTSTSNDHIKAKSVNHFLLNFNLYFMDNYLNVF